METNPIRVCELLVGLPDVTVLGVDDLAGGPIRVYVESRMSRPSCVECGTVAVVKDRATVELVDLPAFGRQSRLAWRKHRFRCPHFPSRRKAAERPSVNRHFCGSQGRS
ncbi:MAG: transposase family protein, partial [bacterium]|nr:transposase family protein [bacterium]